MVFYRKYRPQTISELDSAKLRETLYSVLRGVDDDDQDSPRLSAALPGKRTQPSASVPHAFLLTGPKGLGKTSTARIIAKVVNCENRKKGSIEPCNKCEQCISITNGSNIDILEIDGASNRGIDEIRDLRDKVKLAPSRAKKKVYIIDEVHMLTTEAFNALLKTIEEPPAHVMFLFATTEPQKVPATILSRCFHVAYTLATEDDLVRSFKRIVDGEKIDIDDESLHMIAHLADGGFRDGTKILEEVSTLAQGKKITKSFVEEHYKTANLSLEIDTFLTLLLEKKGKETIELLQKLIEQGVDMKIFIVQLLTRLHEVLLLHMGIGQSKKNLAIEIESLHALVHLFSEVYQQTRFAVIPQLPLELAVFAWCAADSVIPAQAGIQENDGSRITPIESGIKSGMTREKDSIVSLQNNNKNTMDTLLKKEKNLKVQSILRGEPAKTPVEKNEPKGSQEVLTNKANAERLMDNLIFKVKPLNHSVAGVLRGCIVKVMDGEHIVFETGYKFHKERLDEVKTKDIIQDAIREITGKDLKVMVELKA